jgi:hypothetical protein
MTFAFALLVLVESNDTLYGNDPTFLNEIHQRIGRISEQLIQTLKELGDSVSIFIAHLTG